MKLTKNVIMAIVGIVAILGGIGIGLGIGAGVWGSSTFNKGNLDVTMKAIKTLFAVKRASSVNVKQDKLEDKSEINFPVILVPDGSGAIDDKSFNEESGDGILDIYGYPSGLLKSISEKKPLYNIPNSSSPIDISTSFVNAYNTLRPIKTAISTKKKVIVAPGYAHPKAIYKFWKAKGAKNTYSDLYFLLLDQSATYKDMENKNEVLYHTLGIEFDVSASSFKAGYLSALYLERIGDTTPKVGLWGGANFSGVTSFMKGFISGIKYYNDHTILRKVEIVKFNINDDYVNSGFEIGGGRVKADFLIDKGADVILPVAGVQTQDLITAINASKRKDQVKIIGVDTDQSITYSENKDLFLTSISKNLRKATYEGYKAITATSTIINYDSNVANSNSFIGTYENGFSTYIKQFDTTQRDNASMVWKDIYERVDSINPKGNILDWAHALAYIKKI